MYYEIKTERLLLRPLNVSDLKRVHEYASDKENTKYMMFLPHETETETKNFLLGAEAEWGKDNPQFYEFAVVLNGAQIGAVSLYLDETRLQGELGWIISKQFQQKGYATESAKAVIAFAENNLKLQKLTAQCDFRNVASAKVMQKLGMTLLSDNGTRTYAKRNETARELTYVLNLN